MRLLEQRLLEREELGEASCRHFPDRPGITEVAMLIEKRNAKRGLANDRSPRRLELAGEESEKRRLACAVPTDDAPTLSACDCKSYVAEKHGRPELDGDIRHLNLRHLATRGVAPRGERRRSRRGPLTPLFFGQTDRQPLCAGTNLANERHAKHEWLLSELVEPSLFRDGRVAHA